MWRTFWRAEKKETEKLEKLTEQLVNYLDLVLALGSTLMTTLSIILSRSSRPRRNLKYRGGSRAASRNYSEPTVKEKRRREKKK